MLTIKDFKKGDTVYILQENMGRNTMSVVSERTVLRVGRTYVTLDTAWEEKFMDWDKEYLLEKCDFGEKKLLFKTRADAEGYIEKCDLAQWLSRISVSQAEEYSLEQLRKVKEILDVKTKK